MNPRPDHGEDSYRGSGRLAGKKAIITGGDSGIGRAVAIAYAREGADILVAYLNENEDAREVKALIEREGRKAVLVAGDLQDAKHCRAIVERGSSAEFQLRAYRDNGEDIAAVSRWIATSTISGTNAPMRPGAPAPS